MKTKKQFEMKGGVRIVMRHQTSYGLIAHVIGGT